jgi:hypothetical protein
VRRDSTRSSGHSTCTSFILAQPRKTAAKPQYRLLGLAKETRKRNLSFCIPATVQIAPSLRLEHNSAPEVYFSDIFDQHCEETGISREEAAIHTYEKIRQAMREFRLAHGRAVSSHTMRRRLDADRLDRWTRQSPISSRWNYSTRSQPRWFLTPFSHV